MPTQTTMPTMSTGIAAPITVATTTRVRSDGVRAKIRDRKFMTASTTSYYCIRSTNPTPRTVWSSLGPPFASSLRRRYPMNTSTTLVSAAKS